VRDEEHLLERRDLFVVAELLPAVVVLGRRAQHLDHDPRIRHRPALWGVRVDLERAAHHRDVGVRREARRLHPHAQIGAEDPAGSSARGIREKGRDVDADCGVLGRSACPRPDLPVEELMLHGGHVLEGRAAAPPGIIVSLYCPRRRVATLAPPPFTARTA
jgi:hypothetical protein